MNIHEAAAVSGLTPDTIRFYERQGVLPAPPREGNGYRMYTAQHVETLRLAKSLRYLGVPLEEVAKILAVVHDGTCGDVRDWMMTTFAVALAETEKQLAELARTRDHLATILSGLEIMGDNDTTVPGAQPCVCVRMLSAKGE
jgi:MerR family copper efflux transcriptional regulator